MRAVKAKTIAYFLLFAVLVAYITSSFQINANASERGGILRSDAAGYYLWLPAVLIYDDSDYEFCDSSFAAGGFYPSGYFDYMLKSTDNGRRINKYGPGAAISALPFFTLAHLYGSLIGENVGTETHYQSSWWIASTFYVCLGFVSLFLLGQFRGRNAFFSLVVVSSLLFGTNVFHYTTFDAGMSHAFTFGWLGLALLLSDRIRQVAAKKHWLLLGLACAMVVLIRPFNVVMLPVIFVALPLKRLVDAAVRKQFVLAGLMFILFLLIWPASNYWQTGDFLVYGYGEEQFNFSKPHFWQFFVGFEIGAFVYSPLILLMILVAGFASYRLQRLWFYVLFLAWFFLVVWVLSCWESWQYGCTLGNRPLSDWYVFFAAVILMWDVSRERRWFITTITVIAALLLTYSQVVHYQYRHWIIDWCHMTKQEFMDVFLKTDSDYMFYCSGAWDYSKTDNNVTLRDTILTPVKRVCAKKHVDLAAFSNIDMSAKTNHRILITAEARFPERRGNTKFAVYVGQEEKYFDYRQKFIKKEVHETQLWQPFRFEFHTRHTEEPIDVAVALIDGVDDCVEVRNIQIQWIGYD